MGRPFSVDLRDRVVAAVDSGLSRRKAADRFGVSISSAIRWTSLRRRTGDVRPKRQGGDKRSARIEAHAPLILDLVEAQRDMTLVALRARLAEQGIAVAVSPLRAMVGGAPPAADGAGRSVVMILGSFGTACTATAIARDLLLTIAPRLNGQGSVASGLP